MEEAGGLVVIDGEQLRIITTDPNFSPFSEEADLITGDRILKIVESSVKLPLYGLSFSSLSRSFLSAAIDRIGRSLETESFSSKEFSKEEGLKIVREYISALADQFRDEPIVVSVLDGSALKLFLDDEDDFAMLAENLFTDLDTKDTGKLSRSQIKNALAHMGADMGVPPFSESNDLLTDILKKHGAEGGELLGQAQFAQLLQPVLQDLADSLAETHITVIQNIKIINGSRLRKVLDDTESFNVVIGKMYTEWEAYDVTGKDRMEKLCNFLKVKGQLLGLPPPDSNEAIPFLYDQIFLGIVNEKLAGDSGGGHDNDKFNKETFEEIVRFAIEKFAEQLEATPVLLGQGSGE